MREEFAPEIYDNEVSRTWWSMARSYYHRTAASEAEKKLARLLDEEVARYTASTKRHNSAEPIVDRVQVDVAEPKTGSDQRGI
jgi:hypothetical protein